MQRTAGDDFECIVALMLRVAIAISRQADRSPTHMYRTAPLAGLWSRQSLGFYHDGRFQTLDDVINHYDQHINLRLTKGEKKDLAEFAKSL